MNVALNRTTLRTSRAMDFCSQSELTKQTGHELASWPLVIAKELIDNALDACEEAGVAPEIAVIVDEGSITVTDNGSGVPALLPSSGSRGRGLPGPTQRSIAHCSSGPSC